ncbi:sulfotransferase family protein [Aurantiacibacter flavus]|uniref:Sulfotransferase family protein n=1 Tax=Aurantiacibacter flavus TaxID=3145232 RepID=A0ABV0CT82_9SPHN
MKFLGVGWAKTGTTSLASALRHLGFRHKTQELSFTDALDQPGQEPIWECAARHETFEDWPWLLLYREFDQRFPGTRFILTTRDPQSWLISYRRQLERSDQGEQTTRWRRRLYGLPFPDVTDEMLLERYNRHNRDVRAYFADRPDDLLVVNWAAGDGWEKLCSFVDRPVPDIPFPVANAAPPKSVLRRFAGRARRKLKNIVSS